MLKRLANRENDDHNLNPVGYAQIGASFYSWMKLKL
jgi:hypothetical protein